MKHLLNDLNNSEKNRILEQYNNSLIVKTKKFNKLIGSKLGNVMPLLEDRYISEQNRTLSDTTEPFNYFLRQEIRDGNIEYWPNVTELEGRKDSKGNKKQSKIPSGDNKFIEGKGLLYFLRDYPKNLLELNSAKKAGNSEEIKKDDYILGDFDKFGLVSGELHQSLGVEGIFKEPSWDPDKSITLNLTPTTSSPNDFDFGH